MNKEDLEARELGYLLQLAKIMKLTDIDSYEELKEVYLNGLEIIDKLIEIEKEKENNE